MTKQKNKKIGSTTDELLKKLLITHLSIAQVPQSKIAKIVGISIGAVNAIAKYVKIPKK